MSLVNLIDTNKHLSYIAGLGGNVLAIDTPEEMKQAEGALNGAKAWLKHDGADCCAIDIIDEALSTIHKAGGAAMPLFVRAFFGSEIEMACGPFCVGNTLVNMLTPLENGAVASFRVYYGNNPNMTGNVRTVSVTGQEWGEITSQFNRADSADVIDASFAIGRAVAVFEEIIGKKAGTSGDIGWPVTLKCGTASLTASRIVWMSIRLQDNCLQHLKLRGC